MTIVTDTYVTAHSMRDINCAHTTNLIALKLNILCTKIARTITLILRKCKHKTFEDGEKV